MDWTPELLARAFHESYASVSPRFFGTVRNAPDWDSISEKSRQHLIAVCADVLGQKVDLPDSVENLEPVPEKVVFRKTAETAIQEQPEDGLSDWEQELQRDIQAIDARTIRRARTVRKAEFG